MQRPQQHFEGMDERMARAAFCGDAGRVRLQHRLRELQIPIAEFMPGELVQRVGNGVEAIFRKAGLHAGQHPRQPRANPAVGKAQLSALGACVLILDVHQHIARGVPELVAEVAIFLDARHVEAQIAALGGKPRNAQTQGIGAVSSYPVGKLLAGGLLDGGFHLRLHQAAGALGEQLRQRDAVDDVQRIDDVAFRLGHFLAVVVANQAVNIDLAKRHLAREFHAHHDHARDPEENDVKARDQHRSGVVGFEGVGPLRPPLGGKWP